VHYFLHVARSLEIHYRADGRHFYVRVQLHTRTHYTPITSHNLFEDMYDRGDSSSRGNIPDMYLGGQLVRHERFWEVFSLRRRHVVRWRVKLGAVTRVPAVDVRGGKQRARNTWPLTARSFVPVPRGMRLILIVATLVTITASLSPVLGLGVAAPFIRDVLNGKSTRDSRGVDVHLLPTFVFVAGKGIANYSDYVFPKMSVGTAFFQHLPDIILGGNVCIIGC